MFKRLAWLLALYLVACTPLTATPAPTPHLLRLQHTPVLTSWAGAASRCAARQPDIRLLVDEVPANALDLAQADLTLRLGLPTGYPGYAVVLAQEEIVVIVHPQNPVHQLTHDQLAAIYSGKFTRWKDLPAASSFDETVQPWTYLPGDDLRLAFDQAVFNREDTTVKTYLAPGPAAMLEAIQSNPGGIGYLLKSALDPTVSAVEIQGPASLTGLPVLGLSSAEPQGALRQLVLCLAGDRTRSTQ